MQDVDLVNEGKLLFENGHIKESIESYESALKINPKSKEAYYNKGISLLVLEKPRSALECFEKAVQLDPNYASALIGQANCLSEFADRG